MLFLINTTHPQVKRRHAFLKLSLLALLATLMGASMGWAATVTTAGSGDWNSTTSNSPWPGGTVPSSADDVAIRSTDSITVSTTPASSVNSITITGGGHIQLTINSNVILNVRSSFTHFAPSGGSSTVALNGSLNVGGAYASNGANGKPAILRFGPGASCAIAGTYTTVPGSQTDMSNGGTLSLGGSPAWSDSSGTFTAGSGTVVYNRSGNQTVLAPSYYVNLTLSGSGTKILAASTAVYGTLSMQGTATLALGANTLTYGTSALLEYKGSGPQTTSTAEFPATMPAVVTINNPFGVTLDAAKTINKNLTVASGALLNNGGFAITMGSGRNFSVNSGATFVLTGTSGMVTVSGGGTKTFDPASTVNYGGTTQTVSSQTYGNLTIGAGTKTFTSPVTANGTLALDSSAVASLASGGSYAANTLTIGGVNKAPGTWGNTGSGAANIDSAHFAGTGVLNVTSGPASSTSSTALAASPDPSTYGSPVTFTATVAGTGPTPTGTVTFKEDSATLGSGTLNGSGVATCVLSTLSVAGSPHSITAVYGGDGNFAGSTSSAVAQTVNKADPIVTAWPTATDITYGQTLADSTLTGGSATPTGSFSFTTLSTAPSAGAAPQSVTYTPTDIANYKTASSTVNVTVNKANSSVTAWPTVSAITYGQTLANSTLSGGSATPAGRFAFTVPSTAPSAGTAPQSVTYTPTDIANYNTASSTVNVTVNKANSSVTAWPIASAITYGQTLADSTLSGGSATPAGRFAFTTPSTAPSAGTAPQNVTYMPTDIANYNTASSTASVTVNKANPSVTGWPTASAITYGQTLADSTLSGGAATPAGRFAFAAPSTPPSAGTAPQSVTYTPTDIANYNTAGSTASVTVNARPVILTGVRLYDGTATAAAGLLSVANKVGIDDVTVASGSGTLSSKDVGSQTISSLGDLALGGTAAGNYTIAGASGSVTISQAALTITADNDTKVYGDTKLYGAGSTAFTSTGLQNGETIGTVTIADSSNGGPAGADAGDYPLTPSAATGGTFSEANYNITCHDGTLTVLTALSGTSDSGALQGFTAGTIPVIYVAKDSSGKTICSNEVQVATLPEEHQAFTFTIGVPIGTKTISLKPRFYLRKQFTFVDPIPTQNTATLVMSGAVFLGGDANGDNQVDGADYAWLRYWWNTYQSVWTAAVGNDLTYDIDGDGKIDANDFPDLNGDGYIDELDYAVLKNGWYQPGDAE
jgi:hypothetical protein